MRILIADDDRISTMMLERTLVSWGFDVLVASDGLTAWERISGEAPPSVVIADWMMPGLDGPSPAIPRSAHSRGAAHARAHRQHQETQWPAAECSYCTRIRSDHDYWEQVESYITDHTDARFSHGICPSCLTTAMEALGPPES